MKIPIPRFLSLIRIPWFLEVPMARMLPSKEFHDRVIQLPGMPSAGREITRLVSAYDEVFDAARRMGARPLPTRGTAILKSHLQGVADKKPDAESEARRAVDMYVGIERVHAAVVAR